MGYIENMNPYAQQASAGTGLPVSLILAQWAHETGWGSSSLAVNHNNHGGINYTSNADYNADGRHAGYRTIAAFVQDYVRVLNLSFYAHIRQAAAAGASAGDLALMFDQPAPGRTEKYAEDPLYGTKLRNIVAQVGPVAGGGVTVQVPAGVTVPTDSKFITAAGLMVGALALLWIVRD